MPQRRQPPCPESLDGRALVPIVHQSWPNQTLPDVLRELSARWSEVLPSGWQHRLWTDDDNRQLWLSQAPDLLELYDSYRHGVQRADATRILYMAVHGGVYADLDVVPCIDVARKLSMAMHGQELMLVRDPWRGSLARKRQQHVSNFFMASVRGHAFWRYALRMLPSRRNDPRGVMYSTGPYFLDATLKRFLREYRRCDALHRGMRVLTHDEWQVLHVASHHWTGTWHEYKEAKLGSRARIVTREGSSAAPNLIIMEDLQLQQWLGVNRSASCAESSLDAVIGPRLRRREKMHGLRFLSLRRIRGQSGRAWAHRGATSRTSIVQSNTSTST